MLRAASVVVLAAASLAGDQSSIGHHDAVRRRLSQTPDGCALYVAGPVVASSGNQVATVDSLQNYELTFTMELASDWSITGEWQSVLYIGDAEWRRFPHVSFHQTGGLQVVQSHSYCTSCCCQYGVDYVIPPGGAFEAGGTYEIKIIVEDNQMAVYVDGALFGTESGSATYAEMDANVYVGAPWYDAAKVTLSDITLSEVALADVCRENIAGTTTTGSFTFQAGRCYPQSEAPVINTAGLMSSTLRRTGTPQECYDYCTGNSGFNIMGLDLRPTGGQDCQCNHPSVKSRKRGETKSRFARRQSRRGRLQRRSGL